MTQPTSIPERSTDPKPDPELSRVVAEEERTLARIQKHLVARAEELRASAGSSASIDYDLELLSLRNQIQEARLEDVPPLIEEMERLTEVAARRGKVAEGAIDSESPYFGRLVLEEDGKKREVLIGKATYLDSRTNVRIVDWRDAPVSRIYYRYEEGDEYEERFGGREVQGEVATRRALAIAKGQLRRVGCPQGIFVRSADGAWRRAGDSARLKGGQGSAMRAEDHHRPGKLGVGADDGRDEKFLPEITALIDARQFELITKPDVGMVVIQGGAGSGKTTIGLHRLAYLAYQDPKRFRADRMLVLVYNDALVRYISRVLPSLGASGVPVTTFERWASRLRAAHVRGLPTEYEDGTPSAVTRLKKHPRMLEVIEDYCREIAERVDARLVEALAGVAGADEALAFYRAQAPAPIALRLHRLDRWASPEDPAQDGGPSPEGAKPKAPLALRHAIGRTLVTTRRELLDVPAAWADILTDEPRLTRAFAADAGDLDREDLATALRWCGERCALVIAELERRRDEGAKPEDHDAKRTSAIEDEPSLRVLDEEPAPAKRLVARRKASDDDDQEDEDDRSVGVDGLEEHESAKLDREDDALLLRITQRLRGPLLRGAGKQVETLRYAHVLVDEAQDLSPVELAVVMGTTTKERSVTMAGDVAQRLHMDNGFKSWAELLRAVDPSKAEGEGAPIEVSPLTVQYRSTHPIIELAQEVLGPLADPRSGHAIRDGAPVELFQFAHSGEAVASLGEALRELMQAEPRASVCLIARYPEQADLYYKGLQTAEVPYLRRIADQDFPFRAGIDVTDVRQVKGLEFDYVVLLECSSAVYPVTDECRHLLHIAVTRAAHQLWVTTSGEPSLILPESLRNRAY